MNVMQYLMQIADEFRSSYEQIDKRVDEVLDKLDLLTLRIQELELRANPNRQDEE